MCCESTFLFDSNIRVTTTPRLRIFLFFSLSAYSIFILFLSLFYILFSADVMDHDLLRMLSFFYLAFLFLLTSSLEVYVALSTIYFVSLLPTSPYSLLVRRVHGIYPVSCLVICKGIYMFPSFCFIHVYLIFPFIYMYEVRRSRKAR